MVKSRIGFRVLLFALALLAVISVFSFIEIPVIDTVYAQAGIEDDVGGGNQPTQGNTNNDGNGGLGDIMDEIKNQEIDEGDKGVADWLQGQHGMTGEQLGVASKTLSPLTNIIGYITGGVVVLTIVGVTLITALDLAYIAIPPIRNLLYKAGTDGTGAYTGGGAAGGYGMGMGRGMGMGMGMQAAGVGGAAGGSKKPTQWISDEAIACAALRGGSAQAQGQMAGGMGMGMPGAGAAPAAPQPLRSVIGLYFRKRLVFMILLAVCLIVLTSSTIMNCGVNLAEWFLKVVSLFNNKTAV